MRDFCNRVLIAGGKPRELAVKQCGPDTHGAQAPGRAWRAHADRESALPPMPQALRERGAA